MKIVLTLLLGVGIIVCVLGLMVFLSNKPDGHVVGVLQDVYADGTDLVIVINNDSFRMDEDRRMHHGGDYIGWIHGLKGREINITKYTNSDRFSGLHTRITKIIEPIDIQYYSRGNWQYEHLEIYYDDQMVEIKDQGLNYYLEIQDYINEKIVLVYDDYHSYYEFVDLWRFEE